MLKSLRFWIGLLITFLFLFLFLYRTDFSEMGGALEGANYIFLLPALLIYFVGVFFRSVRWRYLLKPLGRFSPFRLFPLVVIGFLVNNILPARLGIIARAYILGEREGISKMATGGTMVVEQVFDGVTLLFFIAIIALFGVSLGGVLQNTVYIVAGLFLGALALCFILVSSPRLAPRGVSLLVHVLPQQWRGRTEGWLIRLIEGMGMMRSPGKLLIIFIVSVLVWLSEAGMFYMVAFSFNLGQPFYVLLLATSVSNLAWALLASPGGLGPFDYFSQQTLTFFGVTGAVATAYVSALHLTLLLPVIGLGFIFLWLENLSLAKIVPRRERLAQGYDGNAALEDEE
ncbi:MAG: lysylphosphatidylglycerol synthase transmembrane domain-containing protein [Dehalococcoidia bacterium]